MSEFLHDIEPEHSARFLALIELSEHAELPLHHTSSSASMIVSVHDDDPNFDSFYCVLVYTDT